MKKLTALFLTVMMLFGMANAVQASTNPVIVTIDGEAVQFGDQQPFKENGTTLVPVRILAEKLGFELEWNDESRTVTVSELNTAIRLEIGEKTAIANGTTHLLPVEPKIINQVAYAPLRFIAEEFGLTIAWDAGTNAVTIETADKSHGFLWQAEHNGNTV